MTEKDLETCGISIIGRFRDTDHAEKFVFRTPVGVIEIAWIRNKSGIEVYCVPCQYYCNLGCSFCHLTQPFEGKPKGNVSIAPFHLSSCIMFIHDNYARAKKMLISYMGVGEPALNMGTVLNSYSHCWNMYGCKNVSAAACTMGPSSTALDRMQKDVMYHGLPMKFHFSLHSPDDEKRKKLIPSSTATVDSVMSWLWQYSCRVERTLDMEKVLKGFHGFSPIAEIHYTLIEGVNDSEEELNLLMAKLENWPLDVKFLTFNPIHGMKPAHSNKLRRWANRLSEMGNINVAIYTPPGRHIGSSCGQFTHHFYHELQGEDEWQDFQIFRDTYGVPL